MESEGTVSAEEEATAIINRNVEKMAQDGINAPDRLKERIIADVQDVSAATRHQVDVYLHGMKSATDGMDVEDLNDGVGGQFDGEGRKMALDTLAVKQDINTTVAQMQEVGAHERFHELNHHLAPMKTAATADDPDALVLGGASFRTDTPVIEGWTVENTGNTFVAPIYGKYQKDLMNAASTAGIGMERLHKAIDEEKDLTLIDDRTREKSDADYSAAMAA